jgi:hypothetical protein
MVGEKQPKKLGYRVLRSTVVLARHSAALADLLADDGGDLEDALARVEAANYDFARLDADDLETVYGYFDDDFTAKVLDEFIFVPDMGSIRDNGKCNAICMLCGKGDSKDEGDNEDHIRFEFRLNNIAGGGEVWTGKSCIINYGLKVKGAATAEEAKKLLERSLREHQRQWMIDVWQAENADHDDMAMQFENLRELPRQMKPYGYLMDHFGELQLAGFDMAHIRTETVDTLRPFRTSVRFYQREGYLTPKKSEAWNTAKALLREVSSMRKALEGAKHVVDQDARIAHFLKQEEGVLSTSAQNADGRDLSTTERGDGPSNHEVMENDNAEETAKAG